MVRATIAASSPTPNNSDERRLRRKWTPQKYRPGTAVASASSTIGNPRSSNTGNPAAVVRSEDGSENDSPKPVEIDLARGLGLERPWVGHLGHVVTESVPQQPSDVEVPGIAEGDRVRQVVGELDTAVRHCGEPPHQTARLDPALLSLLASKGRRREARIR